MLENTAWNVSALPLAPILQHLRREPSRTWSIVITLFGDAIVPRGGSLWLGSLLTIFAGMEVASGVVRTAMSRLASDGWLQRSRVGRNSFYRLTDTARNSSIAAADRIYGEPPRMWDGQFRLVLAGNGTDRETARNALQDRGFGTLAAGVWIAPAPAPVPFEAVALPQMQATTDVESGRQIAARAWPMAATAAAYQQFLQAFSPLRQDLAKTGPLSGLDALVARILLVHEYRRIVLRDPWLPLALLPDDWPGTAARELCGEIYCALRPASEAWLDTHGRDENGPLPKAASEFHRRFHLL